MRVGRYADRLARMTVHEDSARTATTGRSSSRGSDDSWTRTAIWVVGIWVVMAAVIAGWGWLLTHSLQDSIDPTDNDVARWFADQRTPTSTDVADVGTLLGETIVELVAAPIVALAFAAWKRSVVPVVFVALVTAGVGGFYYVGTTLDPRDRPPVKILDPGLVPTHSFPSGHVGTSVALYGSIVVLVWLYLRAARWWVTPLLLLPPACLLARLYEGAHHLTDVLTSLVYASVWLAVVTTLVLRRHPVAAKLPSPG
jgi:membrane-associated phospholipid phosphatase